MNILKYSAIGIVALVVIAALLGVASKEPSKLPTKQDANTQRAYAGAMQLRSAMRNPGSFKLTSALVMDSGAVCYAYRAENGFGGVNADQAVLTPKDQMKHHNSAGFSTAWNQLCAGKRGQESEALLNSLL